MRINTTSDFKKIADLSEINGTYQNRGEVELLKMFGIEDYADSVKIAFINDTTLTLLYYKKIDDAISLPIENVFSGKKTDKYFEIYFSNKQFYIPLIYSRINIYRLRIGKSKENEGLLIRRFIDDTGNTFIFAGGYSREKPYIFRALDDKK